MLTPTMVGMAAIASPFVVLGGEASMLAAGRITTLADKPIDDNASHFTKIGLTGLKALKQLVAGTNNAIASTIVIPMFPFFWGGAPMVALIVSGMAVMTTISLSAATVVGSVSDSNLAQVLGAATLGQTLGMASSGLLALGLKHIVAHRNNTKVYSGMPPDFRFTLHPAVLLPSTVTRLGITFASASAIFSGLGG